MTKIEVKLKETDTYLKLANYNEFDKVNNNIVVAHANEIKKNMERKEKLVSNVGPLNRLNKSENKFQNKDTSMYDMFNNNSIENDL